MQLDELVPRWIRYVKRTKAETTAKAYALIINQWTPHMPQNFTSISHPDLRQWLDNLIDRDYSPGTLHTYFYTVRSFCEWVAERYDVDDPTDKVKVKHFPKAKIRRRVISRDEYTLLLTVAKGQVKELIQFIGNTGVRSDELRRIHWRDVHSDYIHIIGKGDKPRLIDLNQTVCDILARYPRYPDRLLPFIQRHAGTESKVRWCCRKLALAARIEPFGPHALRHYYATELMRRGIPLKHISMALGHASTAVTERVYIHIQFGDIRGINSCLEN